MVFLGSFAQKKKLAADSLSLACFTRLAWRPSLCSAPGRSAVGSLQDADVTPGLRVSAPAVGVLEGQGRWASVAPALWLGAWVPVLRWDLCPVVGLLTTW